MSYCEIDDVKLVLRGTSGELPAGADKLDDNQLIDCITDAQSEVDLALSQVYVTPLNPVPDIIIQVTKDIAVYLADLIFRMSKDYGSIRNPIVLRYTRARLLLDGIRDGKYLIDVPEDNISQTTSEVFNPYCGDLITVQMLFGPADHGNSGFGITRNSFNSLGLLP